MTTIYTFAQSAIEEARSAGRYGTANLYSGAINSFRNFTGDIPLTFKEVTAGMIMVKIRRLNEIIALQNRLSAEANARCVGKTYEVLVEGVSKRSRDQLFGRTEQNRVVVFDRGTHRVGDFVMVKVTESSSATLKGEEVAG